MTTSVKRNFDQVSNEVFEPVSKKNKLEKAAWNITSKIDPEIEKTCNEMEFDGQHSQAIILENAKKWEKEVTEQFGKLTDEVLCSPQFIQCMTQKFENLAKVLIEDEKNNYFPIREIKKSEAAFTTGASYKTSLATADIQASLAISFYEPSSKSGLLVHFSIEEEVINSGDGLIKQFCSMLSSSAKTVEVHIRGGHPGLVTAVKKWLYKTKNIPFSIVSEETVTLTDLLRQSVAPKSFCLNTRDGSLSTYTPSVTVQEEKISEKDLELMGRMHALFYGEPKISVVYDGKPIKK